MEIMNWHLIGSIGMLSCHHNMEVFRSCHEATSIDDDVGGGDHFIGLDLHLGTCESIFLVSRFI